MNNIHKLGFDVVQGCQLRCVGCPNSTLKERIKTISADDFARCLQNIDVEHVRTVRLFNFGEPMLHPDLPTILEQIPKQKWSYGGVEISTNGQRPSPAILREMLKTRVVTVLVVSADGDGTKADYERLRPPASWDTLLEFLTTARAARDAFSPDTLLTARIICESKEGRERWTARLEPMGWTCAFRDWQYLPGAVRNSEVKKPHVPAGVCRYLLVNNLYVRVDGDVVPCCVHPRAFVLGNLMHQHYTEIRHGEIRCAKMEQMAEDRLSMPICGECAR